MLKGFEDYTHDLTDDEKPYVQPIIDYLTQCTRKEKAANNRRIAHYLFSQFAFKCSSPRMRKLINHIRTHDLLPGLCATSKGYFVSQDPEQIMAYVDSLAGREFAIARIKMNMLRYAKSLLNTKESAILEPADRGYAVKCYEFISKQVDATEMPEYTPLLIGNLHYSMNIPNFIHIIMGYSRDYVIVLRQFFQVQNDLMRYNLLNEQIERVLREMPECLFTGYLTRRAA